MISHVFTVVALGACNTVAGAGAAPLPDVDSVLTKATNKFHDFAEQARFMQQRMLDQQEQSRAALAVKKQGYEHSLHVLGNQSRAIRAQNSGWQAANDRLEKDNAATLAECTQLEARNAELRMSLRSLSEKVSVAKQFLLESLKVTDDSDAKALEILAPTTPKPTLGNFLAATRGDKLSLLTVSSSTRHNDDPKEYADMLSNSLSEISSAEADGAAELKAHFLAELERVQADQAGLNATQQALRQTNAKLHERRDSLLAARAHLQETNAQLNERLHGLRVFANTVGGSAASVLKVRVAGNKTTTIANVTTAVENATSHGTRDNGTSPVLALHAGSVVANAPAASNSTPASPAAESGSRATPFLVAVINRTVSTAAEREATRPGPAVAPAPANATKVLNALQAPKVAKAVPSSRSAFRKYADSAAAEVETNGTIKAKAPVANTSEVVKAQKRSPAANRSAANSSPAVLSRSLKVKRNTVVKRLSGSAAAGNNVSLRLQNKTRLAAAPVHPQATLVPSLTGWTGWLTQLR